MSVEIRPVITCDVCHVEHPNPDRLSSLLGVVTSARAQGWWIDGAYRDALCPQHADFA